MAELVGEDAQAAVLGLDGVVVDPHAGRVVRDRAAADEAAVAADVDADAERATGLQVGAGAVAPDGVGALVRVARRLVAAGVHDLEVVDDAVRLVVVVVVVDVVPVLDVEGLQVVVDLRDRHARLLLGVDPHGERVTHQRLAGVADDGAAVVATVERLVEGHLDPLGHVAVDGVAARGLGLVVLAHPLEVHVLVVRAVVVLLPEGGVVHRAVRLRDLVVQGAGDVGGAAVRRRTLEDRVRVLLVAELHEDGEDPVGLLEREVDGLAVRELHDVALGPLLAVQAGGHGLLAQLVLLALLGGGEVVGGVLGLTGQVGDRSGWWGC